MASNLLQIKNKGGTVLLSDTIRAIQVTRVIPFTVSGFAANAVGTSSAFYSMAQFSAKVTVPISNVRGHKGDVGNYNITAFRLFADMANPPYMHVSAKHEVSGDWTLTLSTNQNQAVSGQFLHLGITAPNKSLSKKGMAIFRNNKVHFDAVLGYVHHLASYQVKFDVINSGNQSILLKDLTGLGLDYSKLCMHLLSNPRVTMAEWRGNFYRMGHRVFSARIRVTDNKLYLDLSRWMPYSYGNVIDSVYYPMLSVMVFYVPNLRD